ncbi:MAG: GNAT family N-acetyltransferase [Candidatus Heimdallarchaeaceae archaeon]
MIEFPQDDKTKLVRNMEPKKEDYIAVTRCFNSFKDSDSWPGGFGGSFVFTEEWAEDSFKNTDFSTLFVADALEDSSKMVGVCFCNKSSEIPNSWYVALIGVDPEYQGQKYGKALLLKGTEFAMKKNARFIGLHTWGGNLKALPLYKRQGYKWRPGTDVYMVNYIPQILKFPFFKEFFQQNSWYDSFKPVINQEMDETFDEKMAVYEYYFENEKGDSINIWVDRSVGKISGFHYKVDETDLKIQVRTPNSQAFIGIEEFPFELTLKNGSQDEVLISLETTASSDIVYSGERRTSLNLLSTKKSVLSFTGFFVSGTEELDIKVHPQGFSKHEVIFNVTIDDITFPITLGKIPKNAMDIKTLPECYVTKPDTELELPLEIQNYIGNQKEVIVKLTDGNLISFEQHELKKKISRYDSEIKVQMKVEPTNTIVDYFDVTIEDLEGQEIIAKKYPIIIFKNNQTVSYEIGPVIYIENKAVRLRLFKKYTPGENLIRIMDKRRNLQKIGFNMVLGYPFDTEGNEFFTKNLDHIFNIDESGLWLHSSAESDEKKGLKFTRKIFVPDEGGPVGICFNVENNSDSDKDNLGIMYETWWWRGAERTEKLIFHFNEGIKYLNLPEFQIKNPNKPKEFKEGWNAVKYPEGYIGQLYDLSKIEKISSRFLEEKIPELKAGKSNETSMSWIYFADTWQEIRQKWKEIYENPSDSKLGLLSLLEGAKTTGLFADSEKGKISRGIILDRSAERISVIIDTFREAEFQGSLKLIFDDIATKPEEIRINKTKKQKLITEFLLEQGSKRFYSGKLIHDTLSRIYEYPIALGYFDKTKEITIQSNQNDEKNYLEVDNGFLMFRGSAEHRGHVFHLSVEGSNNYLLSFFPKVQPYLWWNDFYGGVGLTIAEVGKHTSAEFNKLKYEAFEVEKGLWKGIGFKSEIYNFLPSLKGLQATNQYLTLPDSALVLYQLIIENKSDSTRSFDISDGINLKTSGKAEDKYYTESKGKMIEFTINDFESYVGRHHDFHVPWAAYKNPLSEYIVGSIAYSDTNHVQIAPYVPSLTFASIGVSSKRNKLKPKEKMVFTILYVLSKDLESIRPFAISNYEDYFEEG